MSTRLLCSWDFPGKNVRTGCNFLLQGIFPTQGLNLHLLHWQVDSLPLSHQWSPVCPYIGNIRKHVQFRSVQSLSCILCFATPWTKSTPGLSVHQQLRESTQTNVHWVSNAIQPSHPLSSPSPPALNLSQHQSLFNWVSSSHQVAKILEFQLQHESYQRTPRTDLL